MSNECRNTYRSGIVLDLNLPSILMYLHHVMINDDVYVYHQKLVLTISFWYHVYIVMFDTPFNLKKKKVYIDSYCVKMYK